MKIDHDAKTIKFRQSWLGDTLGVCPERGRLAIVKPEWDQMDSDEALIGTASHTGIEHHLNGLPGDPATIAHQWAMDNVDPDRVRWTKRSKVTEIADMAAACVAAWYSDIRPHVPQGGVVEEVFEHDLDVVVEGYRLLLGGTPDYVTDDEIWDWKTTGREYKPWEKQRWEVQPTAYGMIHTLGLLHTTVSWPTTFRYGVMVKPSRAGGKVETQIVTVTRTAGDGAWLIKRMENMARLALRSLDVVWPQVDDSNHLCSSKWCPWWSMCKGAHISEATYKTPDQQIPSPHKRHGKRPIQGHNPNLGGSQ